MTYRYIDQEREDKKKDEYKETVEKGFRATHLSPPIKKYVNNVIYRVHYKNYCVVIVYKPFPHQKMLMVVCMVGSFRPFRKANAKALILSMPLPVLMLCACVTCISVGI